MGDKTDVRLVDTHAKGNGRDDDNPVIGDKTPLVLLPLVGRHPGVIGQGRQPLAVQPPGHFIYPLARQTIDNTGITIMLITYEAQ